MAKLSDVILRGTLAARPAAGTAGRLYFDTTNSILYRDNGSSWDSVEGASGLSNPMTTRGDIITATTAGAAQRLAVGAANRVLRSDGTDPSWGQVVEADLNLTDVTTANVSTTKHGFAPKLPNDATKYLDGTGAYSVPTAATLPSVYVYKAATQSVANNSTQIATFDSERYDTDSMHESVTNPTRITFTTAGKYHVDAFVSFPDDGDNTRRYADIRLNGSTILRPTSVWSVNGDITAFPISFDYDFAAGDYIELRLYQLSGSTLAVTAILSAHKFG